MLQSPTLTSHILYISPDPRLMLTYRRTARTSDTINFYKSRLTDSVGLRSVWLSGGIVLMTGCNEQDKAAFRTVKSVSESQTLLKPEIKRSTEQTDNAEEG